MAVSFLQKASRNIDRLSYLIHDLDEIAKLESGQVSIVPEKFDLPVLIKEAIDDLEYKAKENGITIHFPQKNTASVLVMADRKKIHQVLVNFIDNSIKYGNKKVEKQP